MNKLFALGIIISALASAEVKAQSLSGLSKQGTDMVSDAKSSGTKAASDAFVTDLKSKLKLNTPQVSEIKPLAEKLFKDVAETEGNKLADDVKKKNLFGLYDKFDKKMKGILSKTQWTKYLDVIKSYRK